MPAKKKTSKKTPEEQKPEERKPEEQKPEERKPEERKPEEQKPVSRAFHVRTKGLGTVLRRCGIMFANEPCLVREPEVGTDNLDRILSDPNLTAEPAE